MPKPLVVQLQEEFKRNLLQQDQQANAVMLRHWRAVEASLNDKVLEFTEKIAEEGLTRGQIESREFQQQRFGALLSQARRQVDIFTAITEPNIAKRQKAMAKQGIDLAAKSIQAVAARASFNVLPVEAVESLVGSAAGGAPLGALLDQAFGLGARGMLQKLVEGVSAGHNPKRIAHSMVRDGLSQSLSRTMLIARTEAMRSFREASRQQYQASGVVKQFRRLATKSSRTCAACLIADGELYEVGETLREHPNGTCTTIPVVEGFTPVQWETGKDWLRKQSPAIQRKILGPGRFQAMKDGMDLDGLVAVRHDPTWGDSLQPMPVNRLGNGPTFKMREFTQRTMNARTASQARDELVKVGQEADIQIGAAQKQLEDAQGDIRALMERQTELLDIYEANKGNDLILLDVDEQFAAVEKRLQDAFKAKETAGDLVIRLQRQRAEQIRALVYVDDASNVAMDAGRARKETKEGWQQGFDAFNRMISQSAWRDATVPVQRDDTGRAFARGMEVHLGVGEQIRTVIHELGHIFERDQAILAKSLAFYDRRTAGESVKKLSVLLNDNRYPDHEVARPDKFIHPYMGKTYNRRSTEIVSMGIEYLYAETESFAKQDPDYFDFIYDLLRGR